jgi:hypothetical protein
MAIIGRWGIRLRIEHCRSKFLLWETMERRMWKMGVKTGVKTGVTMLTHEYPYPHEHSRHALMAVLVTSLFFISTDNMHLVLHKLDKNIKWWSIYAFLLGFFYFFSSPFLGRTIEPSYSNFSRWYRAATNPNPPSYRPCYVAFLSSSLSKRACC